MRNLLFSDLHINIKRLEDQRKILFQIRKKCIEEKIERIIFLGDMFDNREIVTTECINVLKDFIFDCKFLNIDLILLAGNHDKPYNEAKESLLDFTRLSQNCDVITFNSKKVENGLFVPYMLDEDIIEELNNCKNKNEIEYIYLHCGINGIKMNNGHSCSSDINESIFKKYKNLKKVFIGHYHEKQKIDKIFYIGNPMQMNFGETDNKGIYIFENITGKIKFIKTDYPIFETYKLNCSKDNFISAIKIVENSENKYIRLFFTDEKEKIHTIPKELLEKSFKGIELKIESNYFDKFQPDEDSNLDDINIFEAFKEYSEQEEMSKKEKLYGINLLKNLMVKK
jgi:DNA repair exonuclease SbcCD nuclease subunit